MKPADVKTELEQRISSLSDLTPADGFRLMLDGYRDIRVEGCDLEADGDMLLFQWGTYDFGTGETFELNLTRQFLLEEAMTRNP